MIRQVLTLVVFCAVAGEAFAGVTYGSSLESPGTPAVTVYDGDVYIAWARLDYTLKFGRFELKAGDKLSLGEAESLSDRTGNALGLSVADENLLLAWADSDGNVRLAYYKLTSKGKFKFVDRKGVGERSSAGVSVAVVGDRGYIGFVGKKKNRVKVAVYDLGKSRPKRKNVIELTDCETNWPCSIAIVDDTLVVAWLNDKNKLVLTTYEIKESSKGTKFSYVKEHPTEERLSAQPALAAGVGEVLAGYVDRDDRYIHMRYYAVESDMSLKAGTKIRVSEKPETSIALAVDENDKIYVGFIDDDNEIALHKR